MKIKIEFNIIMKKLIIYLISSLFIFINAAVSETSNKQISLFSLYENSLNNLDDSDRIGLVEASKSSLTLSLSNFNFKIKDGDKIFQKENFDFIKTNENIIKNDYIITKMFPSDIFIILNLKIFSNKHNTKFIKISSDIFDTKESTFISSWSLPIKKVHHKKSCDKICQNVILTENTIILATKLGENIANYLSSTFSQENEIKAYSNKYIISLVGLTNDNNARIVDLLINEFPGYVELKEESTLNNFQKWLYLSSEKHNKIVHWFKSIVNQINRSNQINLQLLIEEKNIIIQN